MAAGGAAPTREPGPRPSQHLLPASQSKALPDAGTARIRNRKLGLRARSQLGASPLGPLGSQRGGCQSPEEGSPSSLPSSTRKTHCAHSHRTGGHHCLPLPSQPWVATGLGRPLPSPTLPSAWPDRSSDTQEEASARGGHAWSPVMAGPPFPTEPHPSPGRHLSGLITSRRQLLTLGPSPGQGLGDTPAGRDVMSFSPPPLSLVTVMRLPICMAGPWREHRASPHGSPAQPPPCTHGGCWGGICVLPSFLP